MNIPENFDRWIFDYKEGNLSGAEMETFESFLIQNPQFDADADAWNNAFVQNEDFAYAGAASLKRKRKGAVLWISWSGAAAAIVTLLIGITYLFTTPAANQSLAKDFSTTTNPKNKIESYSNSIVDYESTFVNEENMTNNLHTVNDGAIASDLMQLNLLNQQSYRLNGTNNENGLASSANVQNQLALSSSALGESLELDLPTELFANAASLKQELDKYNDEEYASKYNGNPESSELGFDVARNESYDFSSWQNKLKRIIRKIEKAFDVPPTNLTNLRDPEMLLPNSSILAFNPGFAGGLGSPRFEINYRNQWLSENQNSQQMTIGFDTYSKKMRGGIGLVANVKDFQYGQFTDYNLSLIYSPKILLGKNVVFEPAVRLTMGVLNANGDLLSAETQFELDRGRMLSTPAAPQMEGSQKLWYKDYSAGFMINTDKFYAGFSANNLNRHFENVYNNEGYSTPTSSPLGINGIIGLDFENDPVNGKKSISVSPFLAYRQYGERQEIWGGLNFRFHAFTLGGSISHKKDFVGSIGMKFERFKLIYQYDHTYSTLMDGQFGSHNIGVRFNGSSKKSKFKGQ
jgi:type IX secretion system PorP/SprF family membrane protein